MTRIKVAYAQRVVREFIKDYGIEAIPFKIMEIMDEGKPFHKMSQKDRVLCGLRYSEFLTEDHSHTGLWSAQEYRIHLTATFGIKRTQMEEQMREMGYY